MRRITRPCARKTISQINRNNWIDLTRRRNNGRRRLDSFYSERTTTDRPGDLATPFKSSFVPRKSLGLYTGTTAAARATFQQLYTEPSVRHCRAYVGFTSGNYFERHDDTFNRKINGRVRKYVLWQPLFNRSGSSRTDCSIRVHSHAMQYTLYVVTLYCRFRLYRLSEFFIDIYVNYITYWHANVTLTTIIRPLLFHIT